MLFGVGVFKIIINGVSLDENKKKEGFNLEEEIGRLQPEGEQLNLSSTNEACHYLSADWGKTNSRGKAYDWWDFKNDGTFVDVYTTLDHKQRKDYVNKWAVTELIDGKIKMSSFPFSDTGSQNKYEITPYTESMVVVYETRLSSSGRRADKYMRNSPYDIYQNYKEPCGLDEKEERLLIAHYNIFEKTWKGDGHKLLFNQRGFKRLTLQNPETDAEIWGSFLLEPKDKNSGVLTIKAEMENGINERWPKRRGYLKYNYLFMGNNQLKLENTLFEIDGIDVIDHLNLTLVDE
ncbi:MAG: hypothetical protein CL608_04500 [Anaerolineaceae bacterium]|nr:hypothetical protein [Anaerolineaceae bacterium]